MCDTSIVGSPLTIHSASSRPIPPAPGDAVRAEARGDEQAGDGRLAEAELVVGVNASGPLIIRRMPRSAMTGTRRWAWVAELLEARPVLGQQPRR